MTFWDLAAFAVLVICVSGFARIGWDAAGDMLQLINRIFRR